MTATYSNIIKVSDPSPEFLQYCKKELVLNNPDYEKKERLGFWTGDTPRKLHLYEVHGKEIWVPAGELINVRRFCEVTMPTNRYDRTVDFHGAEVPLYDYQTTAVQQVLKYQNGILQAPAGSGKTQMGIALAVARGKRTLWLTHTHDLLKQSKERAERYMDKSLLGTITEGKVNIGECITFATVQTMSKIDLIRYSAEWDTVIVDECHRVAGTPTAMTMFSAVLNRLSAQYKYGLSATVHRSDGMIRATLAILGPVRYIVPDEAVESTTMKVTVIPSATHIQLEPECLNYDGTINYTKMISWLTKNWDRNSIILQQIVLNPGESSIVLSDRLDQLETLMTCLPDHMRKDAVMISGKMTSKKAKAERDAAVEQMRTGEKKYLFATYSLCKEGLDIPRLRILYMASPVKDYAVVTQSIGRIARAFPDKKGPICYDFVDDSRYLKRAFQERCRHYRKAGCNFL